MTCFRVTSSCRESKADTEKGRVGNALLGLDATGGCRGTLYLRVKKGPEEICEQVPKQIQKLPRRGISSKIHKTAILGVKDPQKLASLACSP